MKKILCLCLVLAFLPICGMADRIEEMFVSELAGEGAVRRTLEAYLG